MTALRLRLPLVLAALVVAVLAIIALSSRGDDPYRVQLRLANAAGLREGSGVRVAGLPVGKVKRLGIDESDHVVADLAIDADHAPVSRDVRVAITPVNLLGQKVVSLDDADGAANPAPDGFVVPSRSVSVATDLDQVLGTLDPDTRTRLAVLLNEAGLAVSGRRLDIKSLLRDYPKSAAQTAQIVQRLRGDNVALGDLVERSSSFLSRMAAQRRDLVALVDSAGRTSEALGLRREELRRTLATAPRSLRTLQSFLADLERTTRPLGPAARDLTRTSGPLRRALAELKPFSEKAEPLLSEARETSPSLVKLAAGATPTVKDLRPAARSVKSFGDAMMPATRTLDGSVDNLIAILENWSHAIGTRDQLSHFFRVEATADPDAVRQMVDRLVSASDTPKQKAKDKATLTPRPQRETSTPSTSKPAPSRRPPALPDPVGKAIDQVTGVVDQLLKPKSDDVAPPSVQNTLKDLLGR